MPLSTTTVGLLGSVVALNLWTFAQEAWMFSLRIPEINRRAKAGKARSNAATKEQFFADFPAKVRWPADNFANLLEQPTQFYALALVIAFLAKEGVTKGAMGVELGSLDVKLAWTYVGLRVVHSIVHSTQNIIVLRFSLFATSGFVLLGLAARASAVLFG